MRGRSAGQRGALLGSALLAVSLALADAPQDGVNFVRVVYADGRQRLLLFDAENVDAATRDRLMLDTARRQALDLLASSEERDRVRGLLLLAGEPDQAALDAALSLVFDPSMRVREEAQQLIADHPLADATTRRLYAADDDDCDEDGPPNRSC